MIEWDVQLENLDEQLSGYSPLQRTLLYLLGVAGIVLMGWSFYLSDALDEYTLLQEQNAKLQQQIADNSPEAYRGKIDQTVQAIVREQARTAGLEQEKETVLLELGNSGGMLFDNRRYAQMLDRLLERSVRLGLEIELMESEDSDKIFFGKIREFKTLRVTGTGNFPAIAGFLSFAESQNALVDVRSVHIETDEKNPRFEAVLVYMGVAL